MDALSEEKELARLDDRAVRGRCVVLEWRGQMQSSFFGAAFLLAFPAAALLQCGYGVGKGLHVPTPEYVPWGWATFAIVAAMAVCGLLCQNEGLLDPIEQRLYRESRFLWWLKREIVYHKGEVLGITSEGRRIRRRLIDRWEYRVVALGRDGSKEPMGNWQRDSLDVCNTQAQGLAAHLGCASYAAPPELSPFVEEKDGTATISFGSDRPTTPLSNVALVAIAAAMILYFLIIAKANN